MNCPSCKREIDDNATRCPYCGARTVRSSMTPSAMKALAFVAVVLLLLFIIAAALDAEPL